MAFALTTRLVPGAGRGAARVLGPRCASVASAASPSEGAVGFIGLGAMGVPIVQNLAKTSEVHVWARRPDCAAALADGCTGVVPAESVAALAARVDTLLLCLPSSAEVSAIVEEALPALRRGSLVVDCTSGDPSVTRAVGARLAERGVRLVDCPVSGGPAGAAAGTLTTMVGGAASDIAEVRPVLERYCANVKHVGPLGAGHAVKSINNVLNTAHLLVAAEGLAALKAFGVAPEVALDAINASSGRSLQTEVRFPKEVLTGDFAYGFQLGLMEKDVKIAKGLLQDHYAGATLLPEVARLMSAAAADPAIGPDVDYTQVVRTVERKAGVELRSSAGAGAEE